MTTPEKWPRVKEIVGAALECGPEDRDAFLDSACFEDDQLRQEVDSLLDAYQASDNFSSPGWDAALHESGETPATIGPYRLERELGVGGMGQVWLAEQMEPVRRFVALKLIRAGFFNPQITQRFLAERQSLALMNHPAIAKVFDAGTTPQGQPYFVMEYVDGCPITDYCDRKKLTIPERLTLFQQVCEGVQHAHQKAIIHRDLKPSNILVTEVDGKGVPRIIDFGVAKPVVHGENGHTRFTQIGSMIGTLGYMSPEQADSGGEDVDTRSDVYSLGVVLYELLVGGLPLDLHQLTYSEVLRQLREEKIPRPSTSIRLLKDPMATAQNRSTEVLALTRELRGDADTIVLKALEKDRNRRYATPAELAADIERFLRNEPVSAHAPSFGYLVRKYVARHRVGVLFALAAVLLVVGFVVALVLQLRNTRRERDRADRVSGFMTDMFKVSDPSESRGSTVTAREILDKSSKKIETALNTDPAVQGQLTQVMAQTYKGLGLYGRAQDLEQRVLDSRRRSLGEQDPQTLESMTQLAEIMKREGRSNDADALLKQAIRLQTQALGAENVLTVQSKNDLASSLEQSGDFADAEKLQREVIATETRTLGADNPQTALAVLNLADILKDNNRFQEAEKLLRGVVESDRRTLGSDHPATLFAMHDLANTFAEQGHYAEAEAEYRATYAIQSRVLGADHPDTASTLATLALTLKHMPGRKAESETLFRKAIDILLRTVGPEHTYTTHAEEGLATELADEHRYVEARPILEGIYSVRQRTLGPDNANTLWTGYNLADVLLQENQLAEAETLARRILTAQMRTMDLDNLDIQSSKSFLAEVLLKEGRLQEAEKLAREAFDTRLRLLGPQHDDTQESLGFLTTAMARQGRYREATALYTRTIDAIAGMPNGDPSSAWFEMAGMSAAAGHRNEAFEALHHAAQSGFSDADAIRNDERLKALRQDPRYGQDLAAVQHRTDLAAQSQH